MIRSRLELLVARGLSCALGLSLLAVLSCFDDSVCGLSRQDHEARESFSYVVALADYGELKISGINGSIEITGTSGVDSVRIRGDRIVKSRSTAEAWEHMDELQVAVSSHAGVLSVATEHPSGGCRPSYEVDYRVTLPATWKITARTVNGGIAVSSMSGEVVVQATNGGVSLAAVAGSANVDVTNGGIAADVVVPASGNCTLTTTNGGIGANLVCCFGVSDSLMRSVGSTQVQSRTSSRVDLWLS